MQFQASTFQRFAFAVAFILVLVFGFRFTGIEFPFFSSDEDTTDSFGQADIRLQWLHDIQITGIEAASIDAAIPISIASGISRSVIETIPEISGNIEIPDGDIISTSNSIV